MRYNFYSVNYYLPRNFTSPKKKKIVHILGIFSTPVSVDLIDCTKHWTKHWTTNDRYLCEDQLRYY